VASRSLGSLICLTLKRKVIMNWHLAPKIVTKSLKCSTRVSGGVNKRVKFNMSSEGFSARPEPKDAKISELTPRSRAVNILAKALSKSEVRNITAGRDGSPHSVCDVLVGDETGSVLLTLWDDNIEKVNEGDTVKIGNGYVRLFRGSMRLNVGRYGTLEVPTEPFASEVNNDNNMSEKVFEQRSFYGRRRGGYDRRR